REVAALAERDVPPAAEREDFEAAEQSFGVLEILALAARDIGDRTEDQRGGERQFEGQRGKAESAAHRARGRHGREVEPVPGRPPVRASSRASTGSAVARFSSV